MNLQFWDKHNQTYYILKVPTQEGRKMSIYYRKYTNAEHIKEMFGEKPSLYQIFNSQNDSTKNKQDISKKITVKELPNPLTKPNEEPPKKTKEEVLEDLPPNRTLLMINFDREFEEGEIKKWFRTIGKVRYVFIGKYSKKSK